MESEIIFLCHSWLLLAISQGKRAQNLSPGSIEPRLTLSHSGKSSVLEGITKLPFPRDSGLCTRFATQITFRRAHTVSTTVTIIPHKGATQAHADELRAFKSVTNAALEPISFSKTMKDVHKLMGLSDSTQDGEGKSTFSEAVLKVEVTGPEQEHVSVVDVPGIFRTATKGVTTLADASMVKSMVRRYMDNPRSVMLVVIPANVDIATQEILTLAEEADPDGHRTLGVLTKPDLVRMRANSHEMI